MTKTLRIKTRSIDDNFLMRFREINLGSFHINTPKFAFDIKKRDNDLKINKNIFGINEFYRTIKEETLKKLIFKTNLSDFNYQFNYQRSKIDLDNEILMCFLNYQPKGTNIYPSRKGLEFLLDTSYDYSDIVPLIGINELHNDLNENNFNNYLNYLQESIDIINTLNNKPIIGIIPRIGYHYLEEIIDLYYKNEILAYAVDLRNAGITSNHQFLRVILRTIKNLEIFDDSFIYLQNPNRGRQIKKKPIVFAKDILSVGFCVDSFGINHVPLRAPPDYFNRIKNSGERKLRLFLKSDYGYHNFYEDKELNLNFPSDSYLNYNTLEEIENKPDAIKIFNMEQLSLETLKIQKYIKNQDVDKYIKSKSYVKQEDIKIMKKFKEDTEAKTKIQTNLFEYFKKI